MKNALDMLRGVKFEIDQYQSASFDVEDFNYWISKAVEKWFTDQLEEYEKTQIIADKISCMIKTDTKTLNPNDSTDVRLVSVPEDYRHLVKCLITLRYKQATPSYSVGNKRKAYTKRYTGDNEATFMDNYYTKPLVSDSDVRMYHRTLGDKISILFDTPVYPNPSVVIESYILEYFQQPPTITLGEDLSITVDTPFGVPANHEIVKLCAALFLENEESQRLQTHAAINN